MEQDNKKDLRLSAIGDAVKVWRTQHHYTQAHAAKLAGINVTQLIKLEKGKEVNLSTFLAVLEQMESSVFADGAFPIIEHYMVFRKLPANNINAELYQEILNNKPLKDI